MLFQPWQVCSRLPAGSIDSIDFRTFSFPPLNKCLKKDKQTDKHTHDSSSKSPPRSPCQPGVALMRVSDLLLPRLEKASDAWVPGGRRGSLYFQALQVKSGLRCGRLSHHHSLQASKPPPPPSAYEMPGRKSPPSPPAPPSLFRSPSSLPPPPHFPRPFPSHLLSASFLLKHERRTCYLSCHPSHLFYHANENKAPELFPLFLRRPFSPLLICFSPDEKDGCLRVGIGKGKWGGGLGGVSVHRALNGIFE